MFLTFSGVDDAYELYVNGKLAGKGGDPVTRQSAFSERRSHDVTALVKPGQSRVVAVRVNDWQGAGGIFCPATLGTVGVESAGDILK